MAYLSSVKHLDRKIQMFYIISGPHIQDCTWFPSLTLGEERNFSGFTQCISCVVFSVILITRRWNMINFKPYWNLISAWEPILAIFSLFPFHLSLCPLLPNVFMLIYVCILLFTNYILEVLCCFVSLPLFHIFIFSFYCSLSMKL